jgi:hypothetical protein
MGKDGEGKRRNEFVNKHNIGCAETTKIGKLIGNCEVRGIAMEGFVLITVTKAFVRYS